MCFPDCVCCKDYKKFRVVVEIKNSERVSVRIRVMTRVRTRVVFFKGE